MATDRTGSGTTSSADEWFAKNEEELLRQARRTRQRNAEQAAQEQQDALRQAHWMKCPKCGHDLTEEVIGEVSIDRCGQCEGIFLDRGELEDILLSRSEERRGLFRRILGFSAD